jgi:hypothetical protein
MNNDFWTYYNCKSVVAITECSSDLTKEEQLLVLRLFLDDIVDPDMYGLLVHPEIRLRAKELRKRCWGVPSDPPQGDQV